MPSPPWVAPEKWKLRSELKKMGYVLRVKLASFFAGAAVASMTFFYLIQQDYKVFHHSLSHQMKELGDSLDGRISALEELKESKVPMGAEATD